MAFAVVGVQAHYSKTLLLFFLPQIFNFVLSCPQLFGLVPCPRHRVPRFDAETHLLHPSRAEFKDKPPSRLATVALRVLSALGMAELTVDAKSGQIAGTTNLTILNVFLLRFGPMREDALVRVLIGTQVSAVRVSGGRARPGLSVYICAELTGSAAGCGKRGRVRGTVRVGGARVRWE